MTAPGVTGAPVGVVEVLRKHRADCGVPGCHWCSELDGVIAAVAELIEAATDAHDFAANTARNSGHNLDRRFYRLRAALSSCGGAK